MNDLKFIRAVYEFYYYDLSENLRSKINETILHYERLHKNNVYNQTDLYNFTKNMLDISLDNLVDDIFDYFQVNFSDNIYIMLLNKLLEINY